MLFSRECGFYFCCSLLSMLVAEREPTSGYSVAYSVGTPKWALWEKHGQKKRKTTLSPLVTRVFPVSKRTFFFYGRLVIGRARHPGPGKRFFTPCQLSVEFVNVGGWLTYGDLALDSCAQFLAVAEHRLIPSRARSICPPLRKAGYQSVWSPACQHQVAGSRAGVGVVSLGGVLFCYFWVSGVLSIG